MKVNGADEILIAGTAGAGISITPSAPQVCFDGGASMNPSGFVARLDSGGALRETTYANSNAGEALVLDGKTIVLASRNYGPENTLQLEFDAIRAPQPCLSPQVLSSASMAGGSAVVPGEPISLTGFGVGPENGAAGQLDEQGQLPRDLAGVRVLFDGRHIILAEYNGGAPGMLCASCKSISAYPRISIPEFMSSGYGRDGSFQEVRPQVRMATLLSYS